MEDPGTWREHRLRVVRRTATARRLRRSRASIAGRARSRNRGIQQTLAAQFARIAQMQPQVDLLTKDRRR